MEQSGKEGELKDTRYDLSIDPDLQEKIEEVMDEIQEMARDRPLASAKFCYEIQRSLHSLEKQAALRANSRFKISWRKIAETFGRNEHWAWDRYVASGLSHPKSRRRQTE